MGQEVSAHTSTRRYGVVAVLVALTVVITACSDSDNDDTRQNNEGDVTVTIQWSNPANGFAFDVGMDTHSVDLDKYDLSALAVLTINSDIEIRPVSWNAPSGGHHRSGTLTFPDTTADGTPMQPSEVRSVELTLRDIAGVPERNFQWTP